MQLVQVLFLFSTTMALATDVSAARLILYPGTGNDWYGFGMNSYTLNYNTILLLLQHKFYCGTVVSTSIILSHNNLKF